MLLIYIINTGTKTYVMNRAFGILSIGITFNTLFGLLNQVESYYAFLQYWKLAIIVEFK